MRSGLLPEIGWPVADNRSAASADTATRSPDIGDLGLDIVDAASPARHAIETWFCAASRCPNSQHPIAL
jgi:hypothetical protein